MSLNLGTLNAGSVTNDGGTGTRLIGPNASRKRISLFTSSSQVMIGSEQSFINGSPGAPNSFYLLAPNVPNVFEYQGEIWFNTLDSSHPVVYFAEESA